MNEIEAFDEHADREAVRTRLRAASRRFYTIYWRCFVVDLCLVFLWLFVAIVPIIGTSSSWLLQHLSPVSVALLTLGVAMSPLVVSCARVFLVISTRRNVMRVDQMCNAPTKLRQIAYLSHARNVGRWHWFGYVGSAFYTFFNLVLIALWSLVFGFAIGLSLVLYIVTLISAFTVYSCTTYLYSEGVQRNKDTNVTFGLQQEQQWARYCAAEARRHWKKREQV